MEQSPSWGANRFPLVKYFPAFYGIRKFITAFTNARLLSLSWARSIQSMLSHPNSWRSILIAPYHLGLGFPSGLFTSRFPTKTLYTPLLSSIRNATCPAHLILLNVITRTMFAEEYRSLSSSLCSFLHSPVPRPSGRNILLTTLFSNTHSPRSSLNVSAQISHPYKTPGKMAVG